jgi:hypothetical protein
MIETWFTETIAKCDISSKAATELEQDLELFLIKGKPHQSLEINIFRRNKENTCRRRVWAFYHEH